MREATAEEIGRVACIPHVSKEYMHHGNPRGHHSQTVEYRYCSAVVATVTTIWKGKKETSKSMLVNPLFLEHDAAEAYSLYLQA